MHAIDAHGAGSRARDRPPARRRRRRRRLGQNPRGRSIAREKPASRRGGATAIRRMNELSLLVAQVVVQAAVGARRGALAGLAQDESRDCVHGRRARAHHRPRGDEETIAARHRRRAPTPPPAAAGVPLVRPARRTRRARRRLRRSRRRAAAASSGRAAAAAPRRPHLGGARERAVDGDHRHRCRRSREQRRRA